MSSSSSSEATVEGTPTWIVASVCSVIVLISFAFERSLHYLGKALQKYRRQTLYEALLKLKEELMLLGFISLLLVVFQDLIQKICIPETVMAHWLPCRSGDGKPAGPAGSMTAHYSVSLSASVVAFGAGARRLLGEGTASGHCSSKGKVPLLSLHAIEQIHIFIFVLAITHVVLSAVTVLLGLLQMRRWRPWEDDITKDGDTAADPKMINPVQKSKSSQQDRCKKFDKVIMKFDEVVMVVIIWMRPFFKQFYGSVTRDDYTAMRHGFIKEHFKGGHPKFNFYNYMVRALEKDYKRVAGIKWYFWIFVMILVLLNVAGWHSYFWISLIPLVLLLLIGTKLEHIITRLAYEVASKNTVVNPSDEFFWFHSPQLVLILIHFILFQNAFQFAYFFWTLATLGFNSCTMDSMRYRVPRIVVCVVVQVLCSYSTLPLYAIVSHMGSSFKSAIFSDDVADDLTKWAGDARERNRRPAAADEDVGRLGAAAAAGSSPEVIQLQSV